MTFQTALATALPPVAPLHSPNTATAILMVARSLQSDLAQGFQIDAGLIVVLIIGFAVGDIGKEQALSDRFRLLNSSLFHCDNPFGHTGVFVDDGQKGFGLFEGEHHGDGNHAHQPDGQSAARNCIGDALALFDAKEHLSLNKASQFRGRTCHSLAPKNVWSAPLLQGFCG